MRTNHTPSTGAEIKPVLVRLSNQEGERMNAAAFIEQMYAAQRITQGHANIRKRAEVGKNPTWLDGFPNRGVAKRGVVGVRDKRDESDRGADDDCSDRQRGAPHAGGPPTSG